MENQMPLQKNYFSQKMILVSVLVTCLNFLVMISALLSANIDSTFTGIYCLNLVITLVFGYILARKIYFDKDNYYYLTPFLFSNWFIGCFSLNVGMNVFENLSFWVYVISFIYCLSLFSVYSKSYHSPFKNLFGFVNGFCIVLIAYFTFYLIPICPISIPGILVLGIGFYGIVPAIVLVHNVFTIYRKHQSVPKTLRWFGFGITVCVTIFCLFAYQLQAAIKEINQFSVTKSFDVQDDDIPISIAISQSLAPTYFNKIALKKDIVYVQTDKFLSFDNFRSIGTKQFNQRKIHDPLINVAFALCDNINISADDQINILKSNFDERMATEELLWSGENLYTKNIKEDVKIYPTERLAYSEITIDVTCAAQSVAQKEAIYSFQLPEGGVATSLSLWVNGLERKGVLTTKEKATKAYNQIVGVEARDPSVMHWREGNRIVVRIFPITNDLPRTFKCGFTTPLLRIDNNLEYQNIHILGPNMSNVETISRIQIVGKNQFRSNKIFVENNGSSICKTSDFEKWNAILQCPKVTAKPIFSWNNKTYEVSDLIATNQKFIASEIIIDLNKNWSDAQVYSLLSIQNNKKYVYINKQKQLITHQNYKKILLEFKNTQYSLLPLYLFAKNSIVITNLGSISANFEELESSNYLTKIKSETATKNIKVINISTEINPFWQTMKERQYVSYQNEKLSDAIDMLNKKQLKSYKKNQNAIQIDIAKIHIAEISLEQNKKNTASNHLFRMYAFTKIMQEQIKIQNDSTAKNRYTDFAKQANIVSPISSLIVLETDTDYAKNGIEKNKNTLGNASIKNDGAVPEPHEWILIIISILTLFIYKTKHNFLKLKFIKW